MLTWTWQRRRSWLHDARQAAFRASPAKTGVCFQCVSVFEIACYLFCTARSCLAHLAPKLGLVRCCEGLLQEGTVGAASPVAGPCGGLSMTSLRRALQNALPLAQHACGSDTLRFFGSQEAHRKIDLPNRRCGGLRVHSWCAALPQRGLADNF